MLESFPNFPEAKQFRAETQWAEWRVIAEKNASQLDDKERDNKGL